jgi:hypothetical protein
MTATLQGLSPRAASFLMMSVREYHEMPNRQNRTAKSNGGGQDFAAAARSRKGERTALAPP